MRMFRSTGERADAINLAVRVKEYVQQGEAVAVRGLDLASQKEVTVALTTRGEQAKNGKRPKLSDFRDGNNNLGMDIGGVIGFERCYGNSDGGPGGYYAGWPVFMCGSAADENRVRPNRLCTLQIRERNDDHKLFGTLSVWQDAAIREFGGDLNALIGGTAKWLDGVPQKIPSAKGAAVLRARNAAGEVVAYTHLFARYNKDANRVETGAEAVEGFKNSAAWEGFVKEASEGKAVAYDLVPAVNLDVSPILLEKEGSIVKSIARSFHADEQGVDLVAKGTTFVLDTKGRFVTRVLVHEPYGSNGIDPVLLGKDGKHVKYDPAFVARLNGEAPAQQPDTATQSNAPANEAPAFTL